MKSHKTKRLSYPKYSRTLRQPSWVSESAAISIGGDTMGGLLESGIFASFDRTDISKGIARILLSLTDRKLNTQTYVSVLLSVPDGQDD